MIRKFLAFFLIAWLAAMTANAQLPKIGSSDPKPAAETVRDAYGRDTPQSFTQQLLDVLASGNYDGAEPYFDPAALTKLRTGQLTSADVAANLARDLEHLLDAGGRLNTALQLSTSPQGRPDDRLAPDLEQIGRLPNPQGDPLPLLIKRIPTETAQAWVISAETAERLPALASEVHFSPIDKYLPLGIDRYRIAGAPVVDWVTMAVAAVLAYVLARLAFWLVELVLQYGWRNPEQEPLRRAIVAAFAPLSLYVSVVSAFSLTQNIGVSIIARAGFGRLVDIVAAFSLVWFFWRLINVFGEMAIARLIRSGHVRAVAAVIFLRRALKTVLVAVGFIIVLAYFGVNVTAGVAALSIGGLAFALGAQKSVENLVGGLSIIADQPIRPGDYCRIGTTTGTIEDIGLRSTRIRTLTRTVVTIPNGALSNLEIENYAHRDRFLFNPMIGLRYETTPDQIRYLLVELRGLLYRHPAIISEDARVRFMGLAADSLTIQFNAYVRAVDYAGFLEVQEDLLLRTMDIVGEAGVGFAFPSQTVYLARDEKPDADKGKLTEAKVTEWRSAQDLSLPRFDEERIAELESTLDWPPKGSTAQRQEERSRQETTPEEPDETATSSRSRRWRRRTDPDAG